MWFYKLFYVWPKLVFRVDNNGFYSFYDRNLNALGNKENK